MLRRRLMKSDDGFVDLGLPSGLKWAKGNIVKNGNKYEIGEETDYGAYFSWGNIDGHNNGEGYHFNQETYNGTAGASLTADIASYDATHDAALAYLGSPCRMPTKEDIQELHDYTDLERTTINGVNGMKFMKKTDHSVYIFLPAAGECGYSSANYLGDEGHYWSSSLNIRQNAYAYILYFDDTTFRSQSYNYRLYGHTIRAVK